MNGPDQILPEKKHLERIQYLYCVNGNKGANGAAVNVVAVYGLVFTGKPEPVGVNCVAGTISISHSLHMFNPKPDVGFGLDQFKTALVEVMIPVGKVPGSRHLETTKTSSRKKSST